MSLSISAHIFPFCVCVAWRGICARARAQRGGARRAAWLARAALARRLRICAPRVLARICAPPHLPTYKVFTAATLHVALRQRGIARETRNNTTLPTYLPVRFLLYCAVRSV